MTRRAIQSFTVVETCTNRHGRDLVVNNTILYRVRDIATKTPQIAIFTRPILI